MTIKDIALGHRNSLIFGTELCAEARACPAILACPVSQRSRQCLQIWQRHVRSARHVGVFAHCGHMTHRRAKKCKSYMDDVCHWHAVCTRVDGLMGDGEARWAGKRVGGFSGPTGGARWRTGARIGAHGVSPTKGNRSCSSGQPERHMDTPDQAVPWHARCCHKCKGILSKGPDYPRG